MKGKPQFLRRIHHALGPVPVPGQVLVVENGDRSAAASEDVDRLLEKLKTRVEGLAFFVSWVPAVLADQQNAVDGKPVSPAREGCRRSWDRAVSPGWRFTRSAAQVAGGPLIDVERDDIDRRPVMAAVPAIAVEKAVDDPLPVRLVRYTVTIAAMRGRGRSLGRADPGPCRQSGWYRWQDVSQRFRG